MTYPIITEIETIIVDLPTIRPHHLSMAIIKNQAMVIIRLHCSDGIEGNGESTTIGGLNYGSESPEGIKLTIDTYIAPLLIGSDATAIQKQWCCWIKIYKEIILQNLVSQQLC